MLSAKRFHIFNNFEVECIECKKNHILSSENSFPFYVCIGCEKSRIFMFSNNVRRPVSPALCVSALSLYQKPFFECTFSPVECICVVYCCIEILQYISIAVYNSKMIKMIGLNIKRFSAHPISTSFK